MRNENQKILKNASSMGAAVFLSRIMGLVREQVFATFFGASQAMDAFVVAFRIPNLLRDLFAEGAMSSALVPNFSKVREQQGQRRAWRLAGLVFRVLWVTVGLLAIVGWIYADVLVTLYAESFRANPEQFELAVRLTKIMIPFFPFIAIAAAFMGILNACGYFFIPAFSSAVFNGVSIGVGVASMFAIKHISFLSGFHPIEGMAFGVTVGGFAQMAVQWPYLKKAGYRFSKEVGDSSVFKEPALRRMLSMMVPGTIGLAATQVNVLVNTILATSQGVGAAAILNYAFRLMQFPIGIFGVSMASATLPRLSDLWAQGRHTDIEDVLQKTLRQVFAINCMAAAGLITLGVPLVAMIFEYGKFSRADTILTSQALAMYAVGLWAYSGVKVLVPAFYAVGTARVPLICSILTVLLTITLNIWWVESVGFWALALGTSIGAIFNFFLLAFLFDRWVKKFGGRLRMIPLIRGLGIYLMVASVVGLALWASLYLVQNVWMISMQTPLERISLFSLFLIEAAVLYFVIGRVFGLSEIDSIRKSVKARLAR